MLPPSKLSVIMQIKNLASFFLIIFCLLGTNKILSEENSLKIAYFNAMFYKGKVFCLTSEIEHSYLITTLIDQLNLKEL